MPQRTWIIIGCAVALLVLTAAGLRWLIQGRDSGPPSETPPSTTLLTKPSDQSPPPSLDELIAGLQQDVAAAGATGQPIEATLTITEAEANSVVAPRLLKMELPADLPLEPENLHFDFQPGTVLTKVTGTAYGIPVTAEIAAQVNIVEGRPKIAVTDVELGWLPLPQSVKDELAGLITARVAEIQNEVIDQEMATIVGEADWSITSLTIQEEKATVTLLIVPETGD